MKERIKVGDLGIEVDGAEGGSLRKLKMLTEDVKKLKVDNDHCCMLESDRQLTYMHGFIDCKQKIIKILEREVWAYLLQDFNKKEK